MNKPFWIFYLIIIFLLTLFSYLFLDPNFIYLHNLYTGFYSNNRMLTVGIYLVFIVVLFLLYVLILKKNNQKQTKLHNYKKIMLAVIGLLMLSYPAMLSYDIFSYIAWAKVLVFYKENPYVITPQQFPYDASFLFSRYTNITVNYAVVWVILSIIPYVLGLGNYLLILFSFKLLEVFFFIFTILVLWKLSKEKIISVLLFAFNPLVLIEVLQSGHNDIIMIFLALFAYYLVIKKRIWLAIVCLICSILIKYVTIVLLPVFAYMVYKKIKKEEIPWDRVFVYSSYLMIAAFALSFLHRELYPWYAIWFLPFIYLVPGKKILLYFSFTISLGLLLSDLPYLYLGIYSKWEIMVKYIIMFFPIVIFSPLLLNKKIRKLIGI